MICHNKKEREMLLSKQGFCIHISADKDVSLHGHDFLEFTYIEKGSAQHSIGDKTQLLCEGDYFIVDYGTKHKYNSIDGSDISVINLLFYPDFIDRILDKQDDFEKVVNSYLIRFKYRSLTASPAGMVFHDDDKSVRGILKTLIFEYERAEAGYLEYIRSLIAQILIITMRKIRIKDGKAQESGIIKEITDDIKQNYHKNLRLCDYAKKYNYSLSHISKKFTDELGVGFTRYLQSIRIEQSCAMLESTDMTVSEIALRVGYGNIKFFNRTFKKIIGVSPKAFKKISKQQ